MQAKYTALVAGANGAIGSALARELASRDDWQVLGLSRNAPHKPTEGVQYIQADMSVPDSLSSALGEHRSITHLFYCGRITHTGQVIEDTAANLALLKNVLDATLEVANYFQHVHLVQGGKVYGVHVGPFKTPAREDDPRAPIANFNYDQQDFLSARAGESTWTWSASRPNTLLHFSPGSGRNLVSTLGAYASLCRELGAGLDFPGAAGAYGSITQMTSLPLLARAIAWISTTPCCANEAFNVTNTDVFRWDSLWPRLAKSFGLPVGPARPMRLNTVLSGRELAWQTICTANNLRASALKDVADWGFADATLERYWDEILSHSKLRKYGFNEWDDSEERFFSVLRLYRDASLLPS